jgi:hypothetical protein
LIKDASKNKIKQNNNKVKDWKRETPLAEILFLPGNGTTKILVGSLLTWELLLLQSPATAQEKLLDGV